MTLPQLWYRQYIRRNAPDEDVLADSAYLDTSITDFFGKWLQEGKNANLMSFDALLLPFWSKLYFLEAQ